MDRRPLTTPNARVDPASAMCLTGAQHVLPAGSSSQRGSGLFTHSLGFL